MLTKKPLVKREFDFSKILTLENGIALSYFMYKTLSAVKKLSEGVEVKELIDDKGVVE